MKNLKVAVTFTIKNPATLKVNPVVRINTIGGEMYMGNTTVIPSTSESDQILHTKNKVMGDNVVIKPIPFYETSNNEDGVTVYIGDTIEMFNN